MARGIATPPLVVARAEGARFWDADGREYIDFAGGLGCQNLGHGPPATVAGIHEQVRARLRPVRAGGVSHVGLRVPRRHITSEARERGLVLLSCGIYGNVIRILVPFAIDDAALERGLDILQECLGG